MKYNLLALVVCAAIPALACAKKQPVVKDLPAAQAAPVQVAEPEEEPTITEECVMNVSLVHEAVKNKQFMDAYGPWQAVFNECPNANKSIYTNGAKIVDYLYENTTDPAEKKRLAELALKMCDMRIKYFGDDPKYPAAYVLGQKAMEYCDHMGDELNMPAYGWFKESIEKMGEASQISVLVRFIEVSNGIYKSNPEQYADQYIADYTTVSSILQRIADNPASKNSTSAGQQKEYVDNLFAASGAADCGKLDELYADFVSSQEWLEDLLKLMKLYKSVGCTESDVYFAVAEKAHRMQPTEESAVGCAKMCMKKEDWKGAVEYYNQAIELNEETDYADRADYCYMLAFLHMDKLHRYADARLWARQSLEFEPNQGRCYILIGCCYAAAKPYSEDDMPAAKAAIMNKTVFWAAVDQFVKAKQIDPSCAADADKLIASYSKYYPTKEEMFDLPAVFGGETFIVGGWINEKTICRPAK